MQLALSDDDRHQLQLLMSEPARLSVLAELLGADPATFRLGRGASAQVHAVLLAGLRAIHNDVQEVYYAEVVADPDYPAEEQARRARALASRARQTATVDQA